MDYFLIKPHPEYSDIPLMNGFFEQLDRRDFLCDQSYNMPARTIVNIFRNEYTDFTDYPYHAVPLFSERAMKLIWQFDNDFVHKQIILLSKKDKLDQLYYLPFFPRFPTETIKSPSPPYNKCNWDDCGDIVLHVPYLLPVFMVFPEPEWLLLMRLDVVETLLRNNCRGFTVQKAVVYEEALNHVGLGPEITRGGTA